MIDLLQTAMRSLQGGESGRSDAGVTAKTTDRDGTEENSANEASGGDDSIGDPDVERTDEVEAVAPLAQSTEAAVHSGPRLGFESFLQDLTDYLNSNEYIVEFMADSLRQARSILLEVKERTRAPGINEFRTDIETLQDKIKQAEQQLQTLDQIRNHQWKGPLEELSREIRQQVTEHSGSVVPTLEKELHGEVEAWAGTDESMRDLVEGRVRAAISASCKSSRARAIELFDSACRARNGGVRTNDEVGNHLEALDLTFDDIYTGFQPTVRERFETAVELPDSSGIQKALPLRKRFIDWILFRNETRLRRHILGSENPSEHPIPSNVKAKRLDEEAIRELCGTVGDYARRCCLEALGGELENLLRDYRDVFQQEARKRLDTRQQDLQMEQDEARRQLELLNDVLVALDDLETASDQLDAQVGALSEHFTTGKQTIDIKQVDDDSEVEPTSSDIQEDD
jgi:hypothetical protein